MIVPLNTLQVFKASGGVQDPGDSSFRVPALLQPVVQIPRGLGIVTNGSSNPAINDSEIISDALVLNNQGAVGRPICQIQPGLWSIEISTVWTVDFVGVKGIPQSVWLSSPTDICPLWSWFIGGASAVTGTFKFGPNVMSLNFPLGVNHQGQATGAAQNITIVTYVLANRLG